MNGQVVESKPLYVALAQRKEDRKAQLASQYMRRVASMRMQTETMDKLEENIICAVCLDLFTHPLLLPCSHSICKKCLESTIVKCPAFGEKARCPSCRAVLHVTKETITTLPHNLALSNIIERFKECKKNKSTDTDPKSEMTANHGIASHDGKSENYLRPTTSSPGSANLEVLKTKAAVLELLEAKNPHSFHIVKRQLTRDLSIFICDQTSLNSVVDVIYENCINEPRFRHIGARMCDHLNDNLKLDSTLNFRSTLLKMMKADYDKRHELIKSSEKQKRLFLDYSMALAVFYIELTIKHVDVQLRSRFMPLNHAVRFIILLLLDHPSVENLRVAMEILKLTGRSLEEDEKKREPRESLTVKKIYESVERVARDPSIARSSKVILRQALELRQTQNELSVNNTQHVTEAWTYDPIRDEESMFYFPDSMDPHYSSTARATGRSNGLCRYFNTPGGCWFGSRCRYRHEINQKPRCRFFGTRGGCRNGSRCYFSH